MTDKKIINKKMKRKNNFEANEKKNSSLIILYILSFQVRLLHTIKKITRFIVAK